MVKRLKTIVLIFIFSLLVVVSIGSRVRAR